MSREPHDIKIFWFHIWSHMWKQWSSEHFLLIILLLRLMKEILQLNGRLRGQKMSPFLPGSCWRRVNDRQLARVVLCWHPASDCLAFSLYPAWRFNLLAVKESLKLITHMLKCWCICFCACYLDDWNVLRWCSCQPYSVGLPSEESARFQRF